MFMYSVKHTSAKQIVMEFPSPVNHIEMNPQQALELAQTLAAKVMDIAEGEIAISDLMAKFAQEKERE